MTKQQHLSPAEYRREAKAANKQSQTAKLKADMEASLHAAGLLQSAVTEAMFHPVRKWRLDWYWPDHRVGLELQGGVFVSGPGSHTTGSRYVEDREKVAEAQLHGLIIIEATPPTVRNGKAAEWVRRALESRRNQVG